MEVTSESVSPIHTYSALHSLRQDSHSNPERQAGKVQEFSFHKVEDGSLETKETGWVTQLGGDEIPMR